MLLLLQFICLVGMAFGQFYNGHPMAASAGGLGLYNSGPDSETLPISQEELAQLMAQSLASSSGNYGHQPYGRQQSPAAPTDDFAANYEGDAGDEGAGEAPNQSDEYSGAQQEGQHEEQDSGEESPYQQGQGGQEGADEEQQQQQHYQPRGQQQYQDNRNGYQNSGPSYQQEGEQYQSGQYPDPQSSAYEGQSGEGGQQEQSNSYDEPNRGTQYDDSNNHQSYQTQNGYQSRVPNRGYGSSATPQKPRWANEDSSYTAPGAGYSSPGSESYLNYVVRSSPNRQTFRN